MNTNLNNIPLEIYLDYISEITQQEWSLETLVSIPPICVNNLSVYKTDMGSPEYGKCYGAGVSFGYMGHSISDIIALGHGCNYSCALQYVNGCGIGYDNEEKVPIR